MVWAWKYGLSFRAAVTSAKANFSIWGYLSSTPQNSLLIKQPGRWDPSSSLTKVALTTACETAM